MSEVNLSLNSLSSLDVLEDVCLHEKYDVEKKFIVIISRIEDVVYGVSLNSRGMLCSAEVLREETWQDNFSKNYIKIGSGIEKLKEVSKSHYNLLEAFVFDRKHS